MQERGGALRLSLSIVHWVGTYNDHQETRRYICGADQGDGSDRRITTDARDAARTTFGGHLCLKSEYRHGLEPADAEPPRVSDSEYPGRNTKVGWYSDCPGLSYRALGGGPVDA